METNPVAVANYIFSNLLKNIDTLHPKPDLMLVNNCSIDNLPEIQGVDKNNNTEKIIKSIKDNTSDIIYFYEDFMTSFLIGFSTNNPANQEIIKKYIILNFTYLTMNIEIFKRFIDSVRNHRLSCTNKFYKTKYNEIFNNYSAEYLFKNGNIINKRLLYSAYGFYYGYRERLNNIISYYIDLVKTEIKVN
jgi:hypothetical protein